MVIKNHLKDMFYVSNLSCPVNTFKLRMSPFIMQYETHRLSLFNNYDPRLSVNAVNEYVYSVCSGTGNVVLYHILQGRSNYRNSLLSKINALKLLNTLFVNSSE